MTRARDVADTQDNIGGAVSPVVAGKNFIINGGMDIFQRNTSTGFNAYALDRWYIGSSAGVTTTQSTARVTPNSQHMMLMTASATQQIFVYQAIETRNAISLAGKTVTLSAYAAGLSTTTNLIMILSYSTSVDTGVTGAWIDISVASGNANLTLSSTVTRWSATYNVPSDAKSLRVLFVNNAANITAGQGIYLGDVQLEAGNVATPFSRAGGSIGAELALCQRYYWRNTADSVYTAFANGFWEPSSGIILAFVDHPVVMRTVPTSLDFGGGTFIVYDGTGAIGVNSIGIGAFGSKKRSRINLTLASNATSNRPYELLSNNNATAHLGFSAEL